MLGPLDVARDPVVDGGQEAVLLGHLAGVEGAREGLANQVHRDAVAEADQVEARRVHRIGEGRGVTETGPALRRVEATRGVRVAGEAPVVEDLAAGEVGGEVGLVLLDPGERRLEVAEALERVEVAREHDADARELAGQGDDPDPTPGVDQVASGLHAAHPAHALVPGALFRRHPGLHVDRAPHPEPGRGLARLRAA